MQDHQRSPDNVRHLDVVAPMQATSLTTAADRRLAVEHWLLSTLPGPGRDRARMEWQEQGCALLPLGTLFAAVRLPERVVHAVARTDHPLMANEYLAAALDDGPVIHDPRGRRFYALVPASMPNRFHEAAQEWQADYGVECLGRDAYLGVPPVDAMVLNPHSWSAYWAVPMASAAMLCEPLAVARLVAAAASRLSSEAGA